MKKIYLFAAMAAMLASCSSDELSQEQAVVQNPDDGAVLFSAYVNRGTTRAGTEGELTTSSTDAPKISLQSVGFGVFAYYTDGKPYSETSIPDFMYNQMVSGTDWTYNPVKYWPNEFGTDAKSEGQDKLTFFAYAPYVTVIPGTGRIDTDVHTAADALTSGIVGLTSNVATGDPYVKYYVDFDPDKSVDLCYGVAKTAFTSSVDETNAANTIEAGEPYINVNKPKTADRINFDFKHALAALNVQIDADFDVESHAASALNGATKIWVRSVTFEGFTQKGSLNLNSNASEPLWYELSSTNTRIGSGSVTIYDGRRDGKEGYANAEASNENPRALNANIIQSQAYTAADLTTPKLEAGTLTGVTNTKVNLFDATQLTRPIYVIPTDDNLTITIVYDVETYDPNVAGYLSDGVTKGKSVENAITKEIKLTSTGNAFKLEAGKRYTIGLHLGMTSVKFDADVTAWVDEATDNTDLPINVKSIYATPGKTTALAAGEDISVTAIDALGTAATIDDIESTTMTQNAVVTTPTLTWSPSPGSVTIPANATLYNTVYDIIFKAGDVKSNTVTITQSAAELAVAPSPSIGEGDNIDLSTIFTNGPADYTATGVSVTIKVDGVALDPAKSPTPDYTISGTTVTLATGVTAGKTVEIIVKAFDAPEKSSGVITVS